MTRYFGKVCKKHPAFKGERYKANGQCRGCLNEQSAKWQRENPARARANEQAWRKANPERHLNQHYLLRYGITKAQKDELLKAQGGVCASCQHTSKNWHVDHDHETKKIRGVLCGHCNWMLGHAKDDPKRLEQAARYLRKHLETT